MVKVLYKSRDREPLLDYQDIVKYQNVEKDQAVDEIMKYNTVLNHHPFPTLCIHVLLIASDRLPLVFSYYRLLHVGRKNHQLIGL